MRGLSGYSSNAGGVVVSELPWRRNAVPPPRAFRLAVLSTRFQRGSHGSLRLRATGDKSHRRAWPPIWLTCESITPPGGHRHRCVANFGGDLRDLRSQCRCRVFAKVAARRGATCPFLKVSWKTRFPGSSPAKIRPGRPISGPEALLRNIK